MKKHFTIDAFEIFTETNLREKITHVTIYKEGHNIYDNNIAKAAFAIDYAEIIETL